MTPNTQPRTKAIEAPPQGRQGCNDQLQLNNDIVRQRKPNEKKSKEPASEQPALDAAHGLAHNGLLEAKK